MKKILWVCNTPLSEIQKEVGVKNYKEGWLTGISNQLRKREDIELHYAFPQKKYRRTLNLKIDGITFWGFYDCHDTMYGTKEEGIRIFRSIINKINPDVIHIFGTELPHSLECINSVPDKRKIIVSIQGMTSEIAKVYLQGIPVLNRFSGNFRDGRYQCLITEQYEFHKRGMNEKEIFLRVENAIGRTEWDRERLKKINPDCRYFHCNETLRDVFYDDAWSIDKMQRHSIFVSQGNYPIKGLHILISALPLIRLKYPDTMVYVAGDKKFLSSNTSYGRYIKREIRKFHVENNIVFNGYLTDEEMKQKMLQAHLMVMPSLIKNSPNSIGEAMMLGVPVVAAKVGGIPSILRDGKEGYLYSGMNRRELAQRVCRVFSSDRLAKRFSGNGRKRGGVLYERANNAECLLRIYDNL